VRIENGELRSKDKETAQTDQDNNSTLHTPHSTLDQTSQFSILNSQLDQNALTSKKKNAFAALPGAQKKSLVFLLVSICFWFFAYTALTTHFSDFCWVRLQDDNFALPMIIAQAAAFVFFYPAAILGGKLGRKRTIQIGILMFAAGCAVGSILMLPGIPDAALKGVMYLVFLLIGAGWAMINVHSFVMSVEFANKGTNGFFTGMYYVASYTAQTITPALAGAFMDINYSLLMPYALVFICLAFVTMMFVKHGNERKIKTVKN